MIEFRRTALGLENQHLFYNVDYVIFLEGGKNQYNIEDIKNNKFSTDTLDIIFWKNLMDYFKPNEKIKYKSIGSKTTLLNIANDIIRNNLLNVFVGMDSEFDEILKKRILHPKVFYTFGYSWENDVWNEVVIKSIIEELTAVRINDEIIDMKFNEFLKKVEVAIYADAYLFKNGNSFFQRANGLLFCVELSSTNLPNISDRKIYDKLVEKGITKRKVSLFGKKNKIEPKKFCYGHFMAQFCYMLIQNYIKEIHSISSVQKDIIFRMSIKQYFDKYFENSPSYNYYKEQFK